MFWRGLPNVSGRGRYDAELSLAPRLACGTLGRAGEVQAKERTYYCSMLVLLLVYTYACDENNTRHNSKCVVYWPCFS